jgi:NAD-dependent deacetylase
MARRHGVPTCEINLEPADNASLFDQAIYGPASDCVPAWCEKILATLDASRPDQRNLS